MNSCDMETPRQPQTVRTMMQHLAYQPLLPTGNKYLQQKWDMASYDLHREKVKSATSTIDTTPPKTYDHLALKLKKQKLEEEWTTKIQRENNMLKEKISHIMRTTGGVDNRNYYDRKSLGQEKRQLELLRITNENEMILFRLSQCRPHYNVRIWHEDWLKTLKLMDSIACYPRGRANQQQGQEKPIKNRSDCDKEQKTSADQTALQATRLMAKKSIRKMERGKKPERKKEGTATGTEKSRTFPAPKPNVSEKSITADTPENPGSSDTIQVTEDKPPHTAETFSSSDGSEMGASVVV